MLFFPLYSCLLFFCQDTALGKFLVDNCFNPNLKCQNVNCKRSARDHVLSFVHKDGRVDITVGWLKFDLAAAALASAGELHTRAFLDTFACIYRNAPRVVPLSRPFLGVAFFSPTLLKSWVLSGYFDSFLCVMSMDAYMCVDVSCAVEVGIDPNDGGVKKHIK